MDKSGLGNELVQCLGQASDMVFDVGQVSASTLDPRFELLSLSLKFCGYDFDKFRRIVDASHRCFSFAPGRCVRIGNRQYQDEHKGTYSAKQHGKEWEQSGCRIVTTSFATTHPARLFSGSVAGNSVSPASSTCSLTSGSAGRRRTG